MSKKVYTLREEIGFIPPGQSSIFTAKYLIGKVKDGTISNGTILEIEAASYATKEGRVFPISSQRENRVYYFKIPARNILGIANTED